MLTGPACSRHTSESMLRVARLTSSQSSCYGIYGDNERRQRGKAPLGISSASDLANTINGIRASLVGKRQGLKCFFPCLSRTRALTVSNQGQPKSVGCVLFQSRLPRYLTASSFGILLHAQSGRARQPRGDLRRRAMAPPRSTGKTNLDGKDNYVGVDATGSGPFRGKSRVRLPESGGWWGEGEKRVVVEANPDPP